MSSIFPSPEWVEDFHKKLNMDENYAKIAHNWEGDVIFDILPGGALREGVKIYIELWHGKCRGAHILEENENRPAKFVMAAPYDDFVRILSGELDPMQAMLTRKLRVTGSLPYMMRNVPTVLDFVRCAQEITTTYLTE